MKPVLLVLLLAACTPQHTVREDKPQVDLAAMIAEALEDKPVLYVELPQDSTRVIHLCPEAKPGAFKDSAINEAVRTINDANAIIKNCGNKQLKAVAEEFGLEVK